MSSATATEMIQTQTHVRTISLKTADGELFHVEEPVAMEFKTVKSYFDDPDASPDAIIPLPNLTSYELAKISDYCKVQLAFRARGASAKDDSKAHQERFLKAQTNNELKALILAVNYLENKSLLDVLNQEAADRIKNKSVEYVRRFFGIESDFTEEEEAKIRAEHAWAFEGVDPDDDLD